VQSLLAAGRRRRETRMLDVLFLGSTLAFFLVSLAYVRGCDHL
jgi:hypothetical protein